MGVLACLSQTYIQVSCKFKPTTLNKKIMFEPILHLIKVFTDKTIRFTTKVFTLILIIIGVWFINDTFDFVNSYRTYSKLESLEKITYLLKDKSLSNNEKQELIKERYYIITHKTRIEYLSYFYESFVKKISFTSFSKAKRVNTTTEQTINEPKPEIVNNTPIIKNYLLHFVFSNLFLIIIAVIVPIIIFKQNKNNIPTLIFSLIIVWTILYFVAVFIAWVLNFIPVILDRPWINYILVLLIHGFIWIWLLIKIGNSKTYS